MNLLYFKVYLFCINSHSLVKQLGDGFLMRREATITKKNLWIYSCFLKITQYTTRVLPKYKPRIKGESCLPTTWYHGTQPKSWVLLYNLRCQVDINWYQIFMNTYQGRRIVHKYTKESPSPFPCETKLIGKPWYWEIKLDLRNKRCHVTQPFVLFCKAMRRNTTPSFGILVRNWMITKETMRFKILWRLACMPIDTRHGQMTHVIGKLHRYKNCSSTTLVFCIYYLIPQINCSQLICWFCHLQV